MPYNSLISAADLSTVIPIEYTDEILTKTTEASAVLRLGRRLRDMPTSTRVMPVVSALPTAYFVSGETGLKQTTEVNWTHVDITAEELAVIVPIPQSALDDAGYPVWDQIKPLIEEAAGLAIDQAILYGTNIPATWTAALGAHAGIVALSLAHGSTISLAACVDMYDALLTDNGTLTRLEQDGFIATGHIAHTSVRGLLRGTRDGNGQPIFHAGVNIGSQFATGELDGVPILYPLNGSIAAATSLVISGQWNQLVYAMRKDVSWTIATEAIIQDAGGNIIYNLFQQDMVALRLVMRLGFAIPNPINRVSATVGARSPFCVLTA
jgi:HK97 family phage major capsid protein